MDDRFLRSYVHGRHRLFGRRLAPYSAAHALLLFALQSPLTTGEPVQAEDLMLAARICSCPDPLARIAADLIRPTLRDIFSIWLVRRFPWLRDCALGAWEGYLEDYGSAPEFYEQEDGAGAGRSLTGPHLLILVAKYRRAYGASRHEAWNLALDALRWEVAEADELDGAASRFVNEGDFEEDGLPDLSELDEEQQYKLALQDLGKEGAAAWLAARENQREGGAI